MGFSADAENNFCHLSGRFDVFVARTKKMNYLKKKKCGEFVCHPRSHRCSGALTRLNVVFQQCQLRQNASTTALLCERERTPWRFYLKFGPSSHRLYFLDCTFFFINYSVYYCPLAEILVGRCGTG